MPLKPWLKIPTRSPPVFSMCIFRLVGLFAFSGDVRSNSKVATALELASGVQAIRLELSSKERFCTNSA